LAEITKLEICKKRRKLIKNILFKSGEEYKDGYYPVIGTEIFYYPNGKIKNIIHH
tara:strand:+ start:1012 stop:1176 length:165 start_codon:yes stop_codon:yes gene_type:complete